jgi:hypothetical protein
MGIDPGYLMAGCILGWGGFILMIAIAFSINIRWSEHCRRQNKEWFEHCQQMLDKLKEDF